MTLQPQSLDLTCTVEIIAARLLQGGSYHPVAAALAIAARGQHGSTVEQFAEAHALDVGQVTALEAGMVPLEDLPDQIAHTLDRQSRVDLLAMADLDADIRRAHAARQARH